MLRQGQIEPAGEGAENDEVQEIERKRNSSQKLKQTALKKFCAKTMYNGNCDKKGAK